MAVIKLTQNNFDEVVSTDKTLLIDFYADWCGPCRMVSPLVDEIAEEHPEFAVAKVNVDESPEVARQFNVMNIPNLVVMKGGEVVSQNAGARPKAQILALLQNA